MKYETRILKAIDYIGKHFDEPLTLDELCKIACFSKFHFHRLFTSLTGLSVKQYIRWLKLKRAASQLMIEKRKPILTIAIDAGFESHEAFTKVFKKYCGVSPKVFRTQGDWSKWQSVPYRLPHKGEIMINVTIENMPKRRLALIEHRGNPSGLGDSVHKLITWAQDQPISLKPQPGECFGFAYDDPATTKAEDFRFDLGITIPPQLKLTNTVVEKYLPEGRYATAMHKGSRDDIAKTVYMLYRDWLPNSEEELADLPCIFRYFNFDNEVAETEHLTQCCLLLKD